MNAINIMNVFMNLLSKYLIFSRNEYKKPISKKTKYTNLIFINTEYTVISYNI